MDRRRRRHRKAISHSIPPISTWISMDQCSTNVGGNLMGFPAERPIRITGPALVFGTSHAPGQRRTVPCCVLAATGYFTRCRHRHEPVALPKPSSSQFFRRAKMRSRDPAPAPLQNCISPGVAGHLGAFGHAPTLYTPPLTVLGPDHAQESLLTGQVSGAKLPKLHDELFERVGRQGPPCAMALGVQKLGKQATNVARAPMCWMFHGSNYQALQCGTPRVRGNITLSTYDRPSALGLFWPLNMPLAFETRLRTSSASSERCQSSRWSATDRTLRSRCSYCLS